METLHAVFVYGTLLRGQANHKILERGGAFFVGRFRTEEKYRMTAEWIPYVTDHAADVEIVGELYAVDDALMAALDRLEGHPRFYTRRRVSVVSRDNKGVEAEAWLYFNDRSSGRHLIEDGDFARYRLKGPEYFTSMKRGRKDGTG